MSLGQVRQLQAGGPSHQSPVAPRSVLVWCMVKSQLGAGRKMLSAFTLGMELGDPRT